MNLKKEEKDIMYLVSKKDKSIIELLKLVLLLLTTSVYTSNLRSFYNERYSIQFQGLCALVASLFIKNIINKAERDKVFIVLDNNIPRGVGKYDMWFTKVNVDSKKAKEERILYLKKLISKYEKQQRISPIDDINIIKIKV